jgi:N-acetyl-gamma-glutamyl-phosphate reductase
LNAFREGDIIRSFHEETPMIRVGIVGATGDAGRELIRLIGLHPEAGLVKVTSTSAAGQPLGEALPAFDGLTDLVLEPFESVALAEECDVVCIGVPGTESMDLAAALREAGARVIDIGPDFRLKNAETFKEYYGVEHTAPQHVGSAVYGLPPFYRRQLENAALVAVPGCYPISAILPLRPVVEAANPQVPVVIDAVSGISGAGRSLSEALHFPEMNENVWAYKVGRHQHIPEIEQELGHTTTVPFTPHVGPYTRGILSTIPLRPEASVDLNACYAAYDAEPFIRLRGDGVLPELKHVRGTNFCDIGWVNDARTGNIIIVSAIDNLMGGTAGMAIQCMNLMFGIEETAGLGFGGMSV